MCKWMARFKSYCPASLPGTLVFWQFSESSSHLHWLRAVLTTISNVTLSQAPYKIVFVSSSESILLAQGTQRVNEGEVDYFMR